MSDLRTARVTINVHGTYETEIIYAPGESPEDEAIQELHECEGFDLNVEEININIVPEEE